MPDETLWLLVTDVAEIFEVSPQTVRKIAESGRLRHTLIGGVYKFRPAWVKEYLDSQTRGGTPVVSRDEVVAGETANAHASD